MALNSTEGRMGRSTLVRGVLVGSAILAFAGCGKYEVQPRQVGEVVTPPQAGSAPIDDAIVKSTFMVQVNSGQSAELTPASLTEVIPISIINAANVTMSVDATELVVPPITNDVLSFGKLRISNLLDNDLRACGTDGKKKCGTAFVRIYTTGTAGSGLYNSEGGYGAPISANRAGTTALAVGLEAANAAVVQTLTIPNNKHVLRLSDFPELPAYLIGVDLTNAGAGTYSTTLVLEYGLAL